MRIYKVLISSMVVSILSGCSLLSPVANPTPNLYALTSVNVPNQQAKTLPLTLLIGVPQANPMYQTNQMVYQEKEYQVNYFAKNRWVLPPAQMLQPLLVQALQNSQRFKTVIAEPSVVPADLRLNTTLIRLQQDFHYSQSWVEVSMEVQLINANTQQVIAAKRFTSLQPALANPYGGVVAANQAIANILQQISNFCVAETK